MEIRQLAYLDAVARDGSFTRAAQRLHVAQPGVSAQIRRLEAELGHELLDRTPQGVVPTAVGTAVLPHARAVLRAVEALRGTIDEHDGLLRGRATVGTVAGVAGHRLPQALGAFRHAAPGVELVLVEAESARLLDELLTGDVDVALVGLAGDPPAGVATQLVTDEPLVAAVPAGDPLHGRSRVRLGALAARDLVTLPPGTGARDALDAGVAAIGVPPRIAFQAGDPRVLLELAQQGLGVAVLSRALVAAAGPLHAVAIEQPRLRSRLELAWRADEGPTSPAARALVAHLREAYAPGG